MMSPRQKEGLIGLGAVCFCSPTWTVPRSGAKLTSEMLRQFPWQKCVLTDGMWSASEGASQGKGGYPGRHILYVEKLATAIR